ncbi:hypothetical protein [Aeromicrobium sp.]|uniref:hypothetical protein n=1 Tax=Aeromicrobium sp. TaxID=1871063 RepID=UPI0019A1E8B5|nr:hypothetical protein [Aeromicrobium sp.]MBC7630087.1 hypothetical protein [Aeromicrobium sp.]
MTRSASASVTALRRLSLMLALAVLANTWARRPLRPVVSTTADDSISALPLVR